MKLAQSSKGRSDTEFEVQVGATRQMEKLYITSRPGQGIGLLKDFEDKNSLCHQETEQRLVWPENKE